MKTYPYNYLGICITNKDPEYRGRVKIFIPHIMPALYENWNKENKDITIECVGDNLSNGLPSKVIETLEKVLPWAECASPLIGASVAGNYSSASGQFNQNTNGPDPAQNGDTANYNGLSLNPGSFSVFGNELQDTSTRERLFALMKAEVGSQGEAAQLAWLETVRNRAIVQNTSINNIITNTRYYEPYQNGAYNRAAGSLSNSERTTYNGLLQQALNGSNTTNGATHNASAGVAASVRNGGYDSVTSSITTIGGETYYSKTYEQKGLKKLFENINNTVDINDPTSPPETSAVGTVTVPFNTPDGNTTYTKPDGEDMQPSVTASQGVAGGTGSGSNFDSYFNSSAFRKDLAARGNSNPTLVNGSWKSKGGGPGSSTLCAAGALITAGTITNSSAIKTSRVGTASNLARSDSNALTQSGLYDKQTFPSNYTPQNGDVVAMANSGAGHALTYLNGKWYAHKSGDLSPNQYLATGRYNSPALYRLTPEGIAAMQKAGVADGSIVYPGDPAGTVNDSEINGEDAAAMTRMVQNTTSTQASPIDSSGMPQGLFCYPNPGALLWVFFREGNPLYPVYFAASYGRKEWQSAYQAASEPLYYPVDGDDTKKITNKTVMRFNGGGIIESNGTVTDEQDFRSLTLAHANGAHLQFHPTGSIHYSPNEHMEQVAGTKYSYRLNSESWTQGTDNKVVLGNQFIKVGNPSQDNVDTIEQLQAKIKEINEIMLED